MSLDDFFSKKDKKKGKTKLVAGNFLEQKKEEEIRRAKKEHQKNQTAQEPLSDLLKKTKEDEEWEDFFEGKEVDPETIRIGNLALRKDQEASAHNDPARSKKQQKEANDMRGNDGGMEDEESRKNEESQSVWASGKLITTIEGESGPAKAESEPTAAPQTGGKYLPPNRRRDGAAGDVHPSPMRPRQAAPDLGDSEEFPTLGVSSQAKGRKQEEEEELGAEEGAGGTNKWQRAGPSGSSWSRGATTSSTVAASSAAPASGSSGGMGTSAGASMEPTRREPTAGKYVPPARRAAMEKTSGSPSGASGGQQRSQRGGPEAQPFKVALGNRFDGLGDD